MDTSPKVDFLALLCRWIGWLASPAHGGCHGWLKHSLCWHRAQNPCCLLFWTSVIGTKQHGCMEGGAKPVAQSGWRLSGLENREPTSAPAQLTFNKNS